MNAIYRGRGRTWRLEREKQEVFLTWDFRFERFYTYLYAIFFRFERFYTILNNFID